MPKFKNILKKITVSAALLLLLAMPHRAHAQLLSTLTGTETTSQEAAEAAADSLGRRTPRGTVDGYIQAMADQNYQRASQYLNMKRVWRSKKQRERIVKTFQKLLDQSGEMVPTALISNKPEGRTDDDLAPNKDYVGTVKADGEALSLYVENSEKEGNPAVWKFSQETVDALASISTEDTTLMDILLPQPLIERKMAGVPVGHWVAVVVLVLFSYLIAWGAVSLLGLIIHGVSKKAREEKTWTIIKAMGLPIRLYIAVLLFVAVSQEAGVSIIIRQRFSAITVTIGIVAFLILLWRLSDIISEYSTNRMTLRKRISAISVILFLRRMAKVTIVIIGIIAILGAIGFDVTTWFAALGIGGIALALGAQKTMENFVGSVTLIADQPIRVGDFCKVGDITGTVESIGMRSTRLRTNNRTVVTIPNGNFASTSIENYAHRDRFLFNPKLEFRLESTPNQLRYLLVEIRTLLYAHASVNPEPAKVRLTGITSSAYLIEVFAYIEAVNFDSFQEVQEDLYLRLLDIVAKSGTDFAYPSQTLYISRDKGNNAEKTAQTDDIVNKWKENKEIRLPKFEPEHIEKIKGSIKYPPEDSVVKPAEK